MSRRHFLRGRFRDAPPPLRPPWAAESFFDRCNRCGDCSDECPTGLLSPGDGGFPRPDFSVASCTFCGACVDHCPTEALKRGDRAPWELCAVIESSCLASHGVVCQICAEQCDRGALRFVRSGSSGSSPFLDNEACDGCGACIARCPVRAIRMETRQ